MRFFHKRMFIFFRHYLVLSGLEIPMVQSKCARFAQN